MSVLEKIDSVLTEINKRSFETQIKRAGKDKNRLKNLKDTIQDMGDGGTLTKKDVSDLMNKISSLI